MCNDCEFGPYLLSLSFYLKIFVVNFFKTVLVLDLTFMVSNCWFYWTCSIVFLSFPYSLPFFFKSVMHVTVHTSVNFKDVSCAFLHDYKLIEHNYLNVLLLSYHHIVLSCFMMSDNLYNSRQSRLLKGCFKWEQK